MEDEVINALPKHCNLVRTANHHRERSCPKHPRSLDFEIVTEHIPENFLRDDLSIQGKRHFIFATDNMLQLLSRAKTWYMDGTFKMVKAPFTQLYSIHAFLQKEGDIKQVPLLFALMSSRKKRDYKAVLRSVLQLLPGEPSVKRLVMDFEMAIWKAAESVLPEAERKGRAFHWANAMVAHIKSLGILPK